MVLGILTVGLMILAGGYFLYSGYYSTEDYYVKITTDPKVVKEKTSDGYTYINYNYDVTGYDKDGKPKNLKLSSQEKNAERSVLYYSLGRQKGNHIQQRKSKREANRSGHPAQIKQSKSMRRSLCSLKLLVLGTFHEK